MARAELAAASEERRAVEAAELEEANRELAERIENTTAVRRSLSHLSPRYLLCVCRDALPVLLAHLWARVRWSTTATASWTTRRPRRLPTSLLQRPAGVGAAGVAGGTTADVRHGLFDMCGADDVRIAPPS